MITQWLVPILGIDPRHAKFEHLHAVACDWLDQREAGNGLGETGGEEHCAATKYRAVGGVRLIDGLAAFEITTFSDRAAERLWEQAPPGRAVRFGSQEGAIAAEPQAVAETDWDTLHASTDKNFWTVDFRTPTGFRNHEQFSPWLDPSRIARSMTQRWNTLAEPDLTLPLLDHAQVATLWVTDINGSSKAFSLAGRRACGFVGQIRYACTSNEVARQFGILLRFGEWAGIGAYTGWGLGQVALNSESLRSPRAHDRSQSKPDVLSL